MGSVGLRQAGRNIRLSAKKTSSGSCLVSRAGVSPHFCQKDKMYVESESLIADPYANLMDKKRIEWKERDVFKVHCILFQKGTGKTYVYINLSQFSVQLFF